MQERLCCCEAKMWENITVVLCKAPKDTQKPPMWSQTAWRRQEVTMTSLQAVLQKGILGNH